MECIFLFLHSVSVILYDHVDPARALNKGARIFEIRDLLLYLRDPRDGHSDPIVPAHSGVRATCLLVPLRDFDMKRRRGLR